ncbi:MAG: 3-methyl-2-oxobutanoate hydroxymethyltransferase [Bifidobacteriaceae bacterium]|jgi:3-methyl-2-oxobutanoate hydroxymethyltransferase|nr:3-methyl-2-oxobutanoate hydroxymethyltransferase [Bifidobacteriaceae bacterium]
MNQPTSAPRRVRVHHLRQAKAEGRKLTMLTAYDHPTARIFDQAGIDIVLVGDSVGNVMLGHANTIPVTLDDMERATRAVAAAARRALVIADLPFGAYEDSPSRAFESAVRLVKAGAHGVKCEGGRRVAQQVALIAGAGIPIMGHLGFTPQSEHALGGPRIQARDQGGAADLLADARALEQAGAMALVLELMPAEAARAVTEALAIPTIGIGAGPHCDGQVLVWTDMAGVSESAPKFARRFGEVGAALDQAARAYAAAVRAGEYPDAEHSY